MKTLIKTIPAVVLLLLAATSCRKAEPYEVKTTKVASVPTTTKPDLAPSISEEEMQYLNTFVSGVAVGRMKIRSTDEVYGATSERSYACNEFNHNRIVYYIYGGKSDSEIAGRWFNRSILQWDAGSHTWKVFFNDGVQYFSRLADDVALNPDTWYITLQWVWDPTIKEWIKFNTGLLVHT